MYCPEAAYQILEAGRRIRQRLDDVSSLEVKESLDSEPELYLDPDCLIVCLARVGTSTQVVLVTTMGTMADSYSKEDSDQLSEILGGPMHCMIIPGKLHPMEIEFLSARFLVDDGMDDMQKTPIGTSLPVLSPPLRNGLTFRECVELMFHRHQELQHSRGS